MCAGLIAEERNKTTNGLSFLGRFSRNRFVVVVVRLKKKQKGMFVFVFVFVLLVGRAAVAQQQGLQGNSRETVFVPGTLAPGFAFNTTSPQNSSIIRLLAGCFFLVLFLACWLAIPHIITLLWWRWIQAPCEKRWVGHHARGCGAI